MTGGQEVPDLRRVVEAIIPDVSVFDIDVDKLMTESKNQILACKRLIGA